MSNKNSTKKRARASHDSKATQEQQPIDGDTCEDTQSEFMEFVRSSLNNLNDKLDAFVENQEKLELRITAVEERVTSQEKAVEGVIESVDFAGEKLTNTEHSLERLEKSLAEATREIANSRITVAKLSDTVSRQERHSRSFNIRVLGVREENTENCINILERIIGERFDITGSTIENAHRTGKPAPDRPRHIIARFYSRAVRASVMRSARVKLATTPFRFIDDLSQDDLREKQRVRPYMDELYRLHKKPSFRNGKLFSEGREVTPREIAAYLDRV